ncbi:unnamed protein product, partial [Mesorhabditis spiculigera]
MADMPDLSHLSAEERAIIEAVFQRQHAEEQKEQAVSQIADEELNNIEKQINDRKETARKLVGTQDDAICQICQKTKFADGIGHKCFYCQLRSCARCGGRTTTKNRPIWACSLCKKRQEILMKTGKWFQPDEPGRPGMRTKCKGNHQREEITDQMDLLGLRMAIPGIGYEVKLQSNEKMSDTGMMTGEKMMIGEDDCTHEIETVGGGRHRRQIGIGSSKTEGRFRSEEDLQTDLQMIWHWINNMDQQMRPVQDQNSDEIELQPGQKTTCGKHLRRHDPWKLMRSPGKAPSIDTRRPVYTDLLRYIYGPEKLKNGRKSLSTTGLRATGEEEMPLSKKITPSVIPGDMLAAKIRTYLSHPVTWQPSADQRRLIGHMILHRTDSVSNGDLGLKVVGGRRTDTGRLGAFITQVRLGSVADTIGRLRRGDEVLEWNGVNLQNKTFDQVYEVIAASKNDTQVELIVSRSTSVPGGDDFLNVQQQAYSPHVGAAISGPVIMPHPPRQLPNPQFVAAQEEMRFYSPSHSPLLSQMPHSQSATLPHLPMMLHGSPRHKPSLPVYFPTAIQPPNIHTEMQYAKGQIFGTIEFSLFYSLHERILTVSLLRAYDLPPRADGMPRNPYVKLFLLPDRSEASKRQSSVLAETTMPIWNEEFYYKNITEPALLERILEVTVWDYDKYEANSFLGEVLIDFSAVPLDGQPLKFTMEDMDQENPLRSRLRVRRGSTHQYNSLPQRPRSEMTTYYGDRYGHRSQSSDPHSGEYSYDGVPGPKEQFLDPYQMRRSRTYDRGRVSGGRMTPLEYRDVPYRPEDDWTVNNQSGYLSDHGYSQPGHQMPRHRHRRPRSATAMRPMTAAEMSASRLYSRNLPSDPYYSQPQQNVMQGQNFPMQPQPAGSGAQMMQMQNLNEPMPRHDPRSPNGRVIMGEATGYGSDGSESLSLHSAHSMPTVRTINRRRPQENHEEEEYIEQAHREAKKAAANQANNQNQEAKERKKSLMTRFIPGRNAPGQGKRTGFARSEEVGIPENLSSDRLQTTPFLKQASKESTDSSHSDNWLPIMPDGPLGTFVDDLGPGQVVGRQVLASPVLGEIQIAIMATRSSIDVEVVRAKNLTTKPGSKINPAPYVKVYLMEGKQCIAKAKTNPSRKGTSLVFEQHLVFNDTAKGKMLQITVLGDYGRMERKGFMGIAQIRLDDLDLGPQPVIGWYKLFHSSSLAGTAPVRKDSETDMNA